MSPLCKRRVHGHNRPEGNKFVHSFLHYIEAKECYNKREPAACACPISFCKLHIRELNMGQLWNWWSPYFSSKFLFRKCTKILWFVEVYELGEKKNEVQLRVYGESAGSLLWVCWESVETLLRLCWDSAETLLKLWWDSAETLLKVCWDFAEDSTENSADSQQTLRTLLSWGFYWHLYGELYWGYIETSI